MDELEQKYIDLLLRRCVNFKQSKSLMINIKLRSQLPFAKKVEQRAKELGVEDICIDLVDEYELHDYLKNTKTEDIKLNSLITRENWENYSKKGGALLFMFSYVPNLMDDIPQEKLTRVSKLRSQTMKYCGSNSSKYIFPWCIAALPNEVWAKKLFPNDKNAYEKLNLYIMKMCMVDTPDPIKSWQEHINRNNVYKNKLNELQVTKMHYTNSLGTDLTVEKPADTIWINLDKTDSKGGQIISNMPSYEIFTTPNKLKTNGIVYSAKPLVYGGVMIDEFSLEFENGKAVNPKAKVGQKTLETILTRTKDSDMLGELALVPHDSPISNTNVVFGETLYDENASCHLALGHGFPKSIPAFKDMSQAQLDAIGYNNSGAHVDFMIGTSDLNIEADTNKGKVLVFKNGNFNL